MGSADPSRSRPRGWKLPPRAFSPFADRRDAGRRLAASLSSQMPAQMPASEAPAVLVLALPRGGIPVGYEVARALGTKLDVLVVRKLGAPSQPELGIGAIAERGVLLVDRRSLALLGLTDTDLEPVIARERVELAERVARYRQDRPPPDLRGRTVVLVDDGLATGVTARAAVHSARQQGAETVVVAVPVGAPESVRGLSRLADQVVCPLRPRSFGAVGEWYVKFEQLPDAELLARGQETERDA